MGIGVPPVTSSEQSLYLLESVSLMILRLISAAQTVPLC